MDTELVREHSEESPPERLLQRHFDSAAGREAIENAGRFDLAVSRVALNASISTGRALKT